MQQSLCLISLTDKTSAKGWSCTNIPWKHEKVIVSQGAILARVKQGLDIKSILYPKLASQHLLCFGVVKDRHVTKQGDGGAFRVAVGHWHLSSGG